MKIGGKALEKNFHNIVKDLANTYFNNRKIVVVHGGGNLVTQYSTRLGVKPKFVISPSGVRSRYTSKEELDVYVMVMSGKINKELVSQLISLGVKALGISGADGPTLIAERKKRIIIVDERGRKRVIEGGYTGKIINVNCELIKELLLRDYLLVIAPVAISNEGTLLNVDADQASLHLALKLNANHLIFLTDVEGVFINGHLLKRIKAEEIPQMLHKIGTGMNRKLMMALNAVDNGVERVTISSGLKERPIEEALKGNGTVIVRE